jgi:hypothetical protein
MGSQQMGSQGSPLTLGKISGLRKDMSHDTRATPIAAFAGSAFTENMS